jgi:hypothetical protein
MRRSLLDLYGKELRRTWSHNLAYMLAVQPVLIDLLVHNYQNPWIKPVIAGETIRYPMVRRTLARFTGLQWLGIHGVRAWCLLVLDQCLLWAKAFPVQLA